MFLPARLLHCMPAIPCSCPPWRHSVPLCSGDRALLRNACRLLFISVYVYMGLTPSSIRCMSDYSNDADAASRLFVSFICDKICSALDTASSSTLNRKSYHVLLLFPFQGREKCIGNLVQWDGREENKRGREALTE